MRAEYPGRLLGSPRGHGLIPGVSPDRGLDRDSGFIQVLSKRLDRLGWEHRVLASPVPPDAIVSMRLSALVVDLAVLGPQAWEWLERLCEALPELGIVVCTGPSTVAQRVRGLRLGADDWITKPCHPEEVHRARPERRAPPPPHRSRAEVKPVTAGEVEIRSDRFQAYVAARSIDLTRREFELIELLAAAEGACSSARRSTRACGATTMVRGDRSVDVFVRKLRQKLEKASPGWRYIHTHFGIGYRFAPNRSRSSTRRRRAVAQSPAGWERSSTGTRPQAAIRRRDSRRAAQEGSRSLQCRAI